MERRAGWVTFLHVVQTPPGLQGRVSGREAVLTLPEPVRFLLGAVLLDKASVLFQKMF